MLKLKLQYFGHFMGRVDSLEKILMLGGIGGRRRRGRLLEITSEMTQNKTHKRQTTRTLRLEEQNWAKN